MNQLLKLKEPAIDVTKLESRLNEFCRRVKQSLDSSDFHIKRLALDALDVQAVALNDKVEIKASVPLEFVNLERQLSLVLSKV